MSNVIVTGGSGKAGREVIKGLLKNGHNVTNVDIAPPAEQLCHFIKADLNDYGQAIDVMRLAAGTVDRRRSAFGIANAVIHLAGIPAPGLAPDAELFRNNLMTTYNIFSAATLLGLERVVWASSETLYGTPLTRSPPVFAPITEEHPLVPETGYSLAKFLCEQMATQMSRWNPGTIFVGLRISNILEEKDYAMIPSYWDDPGIRKWNLWSWVDSRDAADACILALTADVASADVFTIAAADTLMRQPSRELMAEHYPDVPVKGELETYGSLLSNEKAERILGYKPHRTWRTGRP